jgi:hypothetical protein
MENRSAMPYFPFLQNPELGRVTIHTNNYRHAYTFCQISFNRKLATVMSDLYRNQRYPIRETF